MNLSNTGSAGVSPLSLFQSQKLNKSHRPAVHCVQRLRHCITSVKSEPDKAGNRTLISSVYLVPVGVLNVLSSMQLPAIFKRRSLLPTLRVSPRCRLGTYDDEWSSATTAAGRAWSLAAPAEERSDRCKINVLWSRPRSIFPHSLNRRGFTGTVGGTIHPVSRWINSGTLRLALRNKIVEQTT